MKLKNQSDIQSIISELLSKLTNVENDLMDVEELLDEATDIEIEALEKKKDKLLLKKQKIEENLVEVKTKKAELNFLRDQGKSRGKLEAALFILTICNLIVLISSTYFQKESNNISRISNQISTLSLRLSEIESEYSHKEVNQQYINLKKVCTPLISKSTNWEKMHAKTIQDKVTELNKKVLKIEKEYKQQKNKLTR